MYYEIIREIIVWITTAGLVGFAGYIWKTAVWKTTIEKEIEFIKDTQSAIPTALHGVKKSLKRLDRNQTAQHKEMRDYVDMRFNKMIDDASMQRKGIYDRIAETEKGVATLTGYLSNSKSKRKKKR